jgi:hypothetical protein
MTEIERRKNELNRDREKYDRAQGEIKAFNSKVIMELYEISSRYNPGDDANKAIYVLAQLAQIINSVATPFKVVAEYERKKEAIKKASGG